MKVNVIKEFVDIHTGELHKVGSSFECDTQRFNEIMRSGKYVEPVIEKAKNKEEVTEKKGI